MSLSVEDITIHVGTTRLLGPLSLTVEPGRPLTILGETGAGKSLLAQAIMGALPRGLTATGAIHLNGNRLDTLDRRSREALWGKRLAMLPQEPWRALDPLMRADAQVTESLALVGGQPWEEARRDTSARLGRLGLEPVAGARLPGTLSGGMAQRIAFAAATAGGASVLLADEPTKGLDEARRDSVVALLRGVLDRDGILLTITHDVPVARALGGDVLILRQGAVVEQGPAETVLNAPTSAYGQELVAADPSQWPPLGMGDPSPAEPVLSCSRLSVARGGRPLVGGINFALSAGQRLAITGPSGLGKTSLLDTLLGLIPPATGHVVRQGRALTPFMLQKLYQDPPSAFASRSPLGTGLADLLRRHRLPLTALHARMAAVNLDPALLARTPDAVSGGELQRLAIARALVLNPAVLLADEPTSRLDPVTQRRVMEVLAKAATEQGAAIVLVTHSQIMAARWSHQWIALAEYALRP